ncbi:MAG: chorismate mutase [Gemmatimonadetes bacterium]|nr:chorismate mutase [Gemmatimonadota bacterium]
MPSVRAIRGATQVEADTPAAIADATTELLRAMLADNRLVDGALIDAVFTTTPDLHAAYPAEAARALGWHDVPMLCVQEMDVTGALPRCVRVLLHAELPAPRRDVHHVYLRGARALRPDLGND